MGSGVPANEPEARNQQKYLGENIFVDNLNISELFILLTIS